MNDYHTELFNLQESFDTLEGAKITIEDIYKEKHRLENMIKNIFGTLDPNVLKRYADAPEMIKKFVDGVYENVS